jgi:hypothetical protein
LPSVQEKVLMEGKSFYVGGHLMFFVLLAGSLQRINDCTTRKKKKKK